MKSFTENQVLSGRSSCDHNCIFTGVVIRRTKKFVTVETAMYGENKVKIFIDEEGNEYCYPHGRYSMATIFRA